MRRGVRPEALFGVWLALLAAFIALAMRAVTGGILQVDVSIARVVQDLPDMAGLFSFDNWLGRRQPLGIASLVLAVGLLLRRCPEGAILAALTYVPRVGNNFIKEAVSEPRPDANLVYVGFPHDNLSFPSGHVVGITRVFVLGFVFAPRLAGSPVVVALLRAICIAVVASVGLGRVWLGAHWPSDALGGYIYATLWLIPALAWAQARSARRIKASSSRESPAAALAVPSGP